MTFDRSPQCCVQSHWDQSGNGCDPQSSALVWARLGHEPCHQMHIAWREGFVLRFCALTTSSVHGKARIKELSMSSVAWRRDQQMFL